MRPPYLPAGPRSSQLHARASPEQRTRSCPRHAHRPTCRSGQVPPLAAPAPEARAPSSFPNRPAHSACAEAASTWDHFRFNNQRGCAEAAGTAGVPQGQGALGTGCISPSAPTPTPTPHPHPHPPQGGALTWGKDASPELTAAPKRAGRGAGHDHAHLPPIYSCSARRPRPGPLGTRSAPIVLPNRPAHGPHGAAPGKAAFPRWRGRYLVPFT